MKDLRWAAVVWIGASLLIGGCTDIGLGLAPSAEGSGPLVVIDLDQRPFPELPFPNDLATRPDPDSPTGLRINASLLADTREEATFRYRLDRLDGFSTFAAISVRFDAPLDLEDLLERHGRGTGQADDAVFVVDLEDGSTVPLDVGTGAYPLVLERPSRYFPNDPRAGESNLLFETVEEDLNGNGRLDPGEDTDGDGVLDHPNTLPAGGDPVDDLITFYERETDTLLLRPLVPLKPEHRYAVVLTRRLVGENGEPVRSPYPSINHLSQTAALEPLRQWLPELGEGLSVSDIAFCWSFTTQSTARELVELRAGLYGEGAFGWLAGQFPPETKLEPGYDDPSSASINPFVAPVDEIMDALEPLAGALLGDEEVVDALVESFRSYVDYLAMGRIRTPYLIGGMDGAFSVDVARGEIEGLEQDEIPWLLAVPKARPEAGIVPPFPVAIYLHGTGGDRLQAMGFAGHLAKFGIATVGLDLPLHGLVLPEEYEQIVDAAFSSAGFGRVGRSLQDNRTIDINFDGEPDPAGNFWGYDAFRSRDCVRQAALDVMRLVQVFSTFDGEHRWSQDADGDGKPELEGLAGDFDGDGRVDIVGPGGKFFVFGISLGGIVSSVVAPIEPKIVAAAPVSSGGGLTDVVVRTVQTGVPELAVLPFMGPLVIGATDPDTGRPVVAQYVPDARFETLVPVAEIGEGILQASTIRLTNLENGQVDERPLPESLKFRLAVPADRGDRLVVEAFDEDGHRVWVADRFDREVEFQDMSFSAGDPLVALHQGFGVRRQSPEFRRFIQMAQTALDAGDPVNYAPLFFLRRPLARPAEHEPTALALILTAGDMNVPISTGVAQARAAGLVGFRPGEEDDRYGTTAEQVLEDNWVLEGLERLRRFAAPPWNDHRAIILDPDNLSEGTDGFDAPRLEPPLRLKVDAPAGAVSVVRFFYPSPRGAHGFGPSNPSKPFDLGRYAINAIGRFFATAGAEWPDALCLADDSCDFIPR